MIAELTAFFECERTLTEPYARTPGTLLCKPAKESVSRLEERLGVKGAEPGSQRLSRRRQSSARRAAWRTQG